jgi:hypothetical protein
MRCQSSHVKQFECASPLGLSAMLEPTHYNLCGIGCTPGDTRHLATVQPSMYSKASPGVVRNGLITKILPQLLLLRYAPVTPLTPPNEPCCVGHNMYAAALRRYTKALVP